MQMPDGMQFPMDATFVEVLAEKMIVFTARIHGGLDVHTTVTFEDEPGGKTKLTVHQVYAFENDAVRGAKQGWTQTLDQLEAFVRSRAS